MEEGRWHHRITTQSTASSNPLLCSHSPPAAGHSSPHCYAAATSSGDCGHYPRRHGLAGKIASAFQTIPRGGRLSCVPTGYALQHLREKHREDRTTRCRREVKERHDTRARSPFRHDRGGWSPRRRAATKRHWGAVQPCEATRAGRGAASCRRKRRRSALRYPSSRRSGAMGE